MKDFYTQNDVIRSTALDAIPFVTHGFFTRNGGVSALPHTATMNLGYGRGDPDEAVDENFRILREKRGLCGAPPCLCQTIQQRLRLFDEICCIYT